MAVSRVLIVGRFRELASHLTSRGHEVAGVGSFEEALVWLDDPPDLVVTAAEVGGESGLELVARFRRVRPAERLGILVMTLGDEAAILRGYAAGASDVIPRDSTLPVQLAKCGHLCDLVGRASAGGPLPAIGDELLGRYRLERLLGSGSYGAVYAAWDLEREDKVALKVMTRGEGLTPEGQERFLREAYTLSAIQDPHVVKARDFGRKAGLLYCAMELVQGATLLAKVRAEGPCSPREGFDLLLGLTRALHAMERLALVHRDIKPANVMLRGRRYDQPVLVDFGLAKGDFDAGVTSPDVILGSPGYIAPEALTRATDHRSDLFALGQVVLFALRGGEAFPHLLGFDVVVQMSHQLAAIPSSVQGPLRGVLAGLIAIEPDERIPRASDVLELLSAFDPSVLATQADEMQDPPPDQAPTQRRGG